MKQLSANFRRFSMVLAALTVISAASCSKEQKPEENPVPTAPSADENTATGDSDSGRAMGLQTIHFPYDAFVLNDEAKNQLKANSDILKDKSSIKIQIEGHAD